MPSTLRFILDGEMPDFLLAKDLILQVSITIKFQIFGGNDLITKFDCSIQIIGEITVSGATYRSMEFVGSTVESLSVSSPVNPSLLISIR